MPSPSACVLIIGNEILSGRTQDANLAFLGQRCDALGIRLVEARVIADNEAAIIAHINECRARFTYVFTTGGIGPTHDDITSATVARVFGVPLRRSPEAVEALDRYYEPGTLNEARLRMADIPEGARLIGNPVSGAPGFQLENVFVLPGVPSIMQVMFDGIVDRLSGGPPILTVSVTTDLLEGAMASDLGAIQSAFPDVSVGSYPFFRRGTLGVNLVLRSIAAGRIAACRAAIEEMLKRLGGRILNRGAPKST
ncbi:MAG: competence/damage-inducible protein A [Gammaproteobacteria bacterium]|nr:competence/damage-inducible protein A [Gammaproteobacteria bacterium]